MKKLFLVALVTCAALLAQDAPAEKVYTTAYDNVLPQGADGAGWVTRIMLVNMDPTRDATYDLQFYRDSGAPWPIQLKDSTTTSSVWHGTIPKAGSLFIETAGTAPTNAAQGRAFFVPNHLTSFTSLPTVR